MPTLNSNSVQKKPVLTDLPGEGQANDDAQHEGEEDLRHVTQVCARCLAHLPSRK